jgi:hypothetical protein
LNRNNIIGLVAQSDGSRRGILGVPRGVTFEVGWTL